MNRKAFIFYLTDVCKCEVIREDVQGYCIVKNLENGLKHGVPANDPLRAATVCRICKVLMIDTPDEAKSAQLIIDMAHKNHQDNQK